MDSIAKQFEYTEVYARSLFELARERGQVDEVRRDLAELARVYELAPDLQEIGEGEMIDKERRAELFERLLRGKLNDLVLNTLLVMNANGRRCPALVLHRCFELQAQRAAGEIEGAVTSAVPLDGGQQEELRRLAERLSGLKPLLEFRVDPSLLGGLILQVGDWRYDNSIRRHLRVARRRLAERGEIGLSVGVTAD